MISQFYIMSSWMMKDLIVSKFSNLWFQLHCTFQSGNHKTGKLNVTTSLLHIPLFLTYNQIRIWCIARAVYLVAMGSNPDLHTSTKYGEKYNCSKNGGKIWKNVKRVILTQIISIGPKFSTQKSINNGFFYSFKFWKRCWSLLYH